MKINKERLEGILNDLIEWGCDHDYVFIECFTTAAEISLKEASALGLARWHEEVEELRGLYNKYCRKWYEEHSGPEYKGMEPACFGEWITCEHGMCYDLDKVFTKARLEEIINNLFGWGAEHDDDFMESMISAAGLSNEECEYFQLDDDDDESDKVMTLSNGVIDYENFAAWSLAAVIKHNNGSMEDALDDIGIKDEEERKKIKEWYGWDEDMPEEVTIKLDDLALDDIDDEEEVEDAIRDYLNDEYENYAVSFNWERGDDVDTLNVYDIKWTTYKD